MAYYVLDVNVISRRYYFIEKRQFLLFMIHHQSEFPSSRKDAFSNFKTDKTINIHANITPYGFKIQSWVFKKRDGFSLLNLKNPKFSCGRDGRGREPELALLHTNSFVGNNFPKRTQFDWTISTYLMKYNIESEYNYNVTVLHF